MKQWELRAVIFDLDGVIVSTDVYHFRAWKQIADQEGIPFDRKDNDKLRGVGRMESLDLLLGERKNLYTAERKQELAEQKNCVYRKLLQELTPQDILPGVIELLAELKKDGIRTAIGSSSKNTEYILLRIGLKDSFDTVVSGNDIKRSKPDPEVYILAAKKLGVLPEDCIVVEDAKAGIDAGNAAGAFTFAVGSACGYSRAGACRADLRGMTSAQMKDFFSCR